MPFSSRLTLYRLLLTAMINGLRLLLLAPDSILLRLSHLVLSLK